MIVIFFLRAMCASTELTLSSWTKRWSKLMIDNTRSLQRHLHGDEAHKRLWSNWKRDWVGLDFFWVGFISSVGLDAPRSQMIDDVNGVSDVNDFNESSSEQARPLLQGAEPRAQGTCDRPVALPPPTGPEHALRHRCSPHLACAPRLPRHAPRLPHQACFGPRHALRLPRHAPRLPHQACASRLPRQACAGSKIGKVYHPTES